MMVLILGAGQLARMLYLESVQLGIEVLAYDVSSSKVVDPVTREPLKWTLREAMDASDVVTVEFEHIDEELLQLAADRGKLRPSKEAILVGGDRVTEKNLLSRLDIPNCRYEVITELDGLTAISERLGSELIVKTSKGGYDGKGQWALNGAADVMRLQETLKQFDLAANPLVVEKKAIFTREVSIIGARSLAGEVAIYALTENIHHDGQLQVAVAPAVGITAGQREQLCRMFERISDALNYVGILAIETFQVGDEFVVNELAPRVHNSGHWTQNGADTSQFEQHMRAILGFPLGATVAAPVAVMVNIIGCASFSRKMLGIPGCHMHWYGKQVRAKRKMGHFNITAPSVHDMADKLTQLQATLPSEHFPKLELAISRLQGN